MIDGVVATLRAAGFDASLVARRANFFDTKIVAYIVPQSCIEGTADIIIAVPETFPSTPPYGFFAMSPLTRRAGAWRHVSSAAPYPTAQFFSRTCQGWDPNQHDILTFLAYVNQWIAQ